MSNPNPNQGRQDDPMVLVDRFTNGICGMVTSITRAPTKDKQWEPKDIEELGKQINELLGDIRFRMKYLIFDNEATHRENMYLRNALAKIRADEGPIDPPPGIHLDTSDPSDPEDEDD